MAKPFLHAYICQFPSATMCMREKLKYIYIYLFYIKLHVGNHYSLVTKLLWLGNTLNTTIFVSLWNRICNLYIITPWPASSLQGLEVTFPTKPKKKKKNLLLEFRSQIYIYSYDCGQLVYWLFLLICHLFFFFYFFFLHVIIICANFKVIIVSI